MNRGVSFGLEIPNWLGWPVLLVIGWLIVQEKGKRSGLVLVLTGGVLNMYERLMTGGVTDNLNLFGILNNNLADYMILAGIAIYGWQIFTHRGGVE